MQGFKIPKQLATGLFTDIIVPSVGQNGYGAIWNNSTKKIEWAQFEALGAVASGIATHVALSNPHSQYPLSSSLGTAAYLNVGTSANNIVQLNSSGFLPALNGSLLTNLPATTPGGSSGYIQYNNAGAFGASGVYWDSVNSRVGIGTTSPGQKLDVNGSVNVATALIVPVVRPASDSTTALKIKTAADSDFIFFDTTNKRVGIGVQPSYGFHVLTSNATTSAYFRNEKTTGTAIAFAASAYAIGATYAVGFSCNTGGATHNIDALIGDILPPTGLWHIYTGGNPSYFGGTLYVQSTSAANARIIIGACDSSNAHIRFVSGTAPSSPADGQIWYPTSGRLTLRRSTTSEIFATGIQSTGGAATAGASYGATEQGMLQKIYDAGRAFGLLN